jgi:membrane-bound metal-dependent hydrolase YbcI (DUF457 family)
LVFGLQMIAYNASRAAGDAIVVMHPLIVALIVWIAALNNSKWSAISRVIAGVVVAVALSLLNYAFLHFLLVDALRILSDDLFFYFGTVYGFLLLIAAVLGGVAAALAVPRASERRSAQ